MDGPFDFGLSYLACLLDMRVGVSRGSLHQCAACRLRAVDI